LNLINFSIRNNMIIIKLQGGLGNQMFQYAFATIVAKKNNTVVYLDKNFFSLIEKRAGFTPRSFELDIFNNKYFEATQSQVTSFFSLSFLEKIKRKLKFNYHKIYNETIFGFNQSALNIKAPVYLNGYFQSSKYFIGYERLIKDLFLFPINELDTLNKELLLKIKKANTISVHIRRGDYIEDKVTHQFHGCCSLEYYLKAITLLMDRYKNFTLVFFSDDSNWVKEQFENFPYPKLFIDNNSAENSWVDMLLMSSCKHNIIANSSFSWWAAWLNENLDKTVVAPKKWFETKDLDTKTLLPKEWIQL
jgi:hypothetical protein